MSAGSAGFVPAELADIVTPLTRGERLVPLATVQTHRSPIRILDEAGLTRAEVVDDRVQVLNAEGDLVAQFREVEVEAWDADRDGDVLAAVVPVPAGEAEEATDAVEPSDIDPASGPAAG